MYEKAIIISISLNLYDNPIYIHTYTHTKQQQPNSPFFIFPIIYYCSKNSISTHEGVMMRAWSYLFFSQKLEKVQWMYGSEIESCEGVGAGYCRVRLWKFNFPTVFQLNFHDERERERANKNSLIIHSNEFVSMRWWMKCSFHLFFILFYAQHNGRVMWKSLNCNISALKSGAPVGGGVAMGMNNGKFLHCRVRKNFLISCFFSAHSFASEHGSFCKLQFASWNDSWRAALIQLASFESDVKRLQNSDKRREI